jgi:RNA polymerase sigma-70 factor, ECF subfamily
VTISSVGKTSRDDLYREATATYGTALDRLARAYEADPDKRRDLFQEIHVALWRSFETFERRCSLRTWVYRVAHNTAASHVIRQHRANSKAFVNLEELETLPDPSDHGHAAEDRMALDRLLELIHRLKPLDREVMLLYLEDTDAASIGEITGLSAGSVRTQIHRIKALLTRRFHLRRTL